MLNIHSVPMLVAGILCTVLAVITWLFRRRERINRAFSFLTLALAIDSFAYFAMFQFGHRIADIVPWMRITFTVGFLVPTALVLFFFAFTGYADRLSEKVLGIQARHFRIFAFSFILVSILLSVFTSFLVRVPASPEHMWDLELGPLGKAMFPLYSVLFVYLFAMAYKAQKAAQESSERHFILLLAAGTALWLIFGYGGALLFPPSSEAWHSTTYIGTSVMAVFFFVAIVHHQSDKLYELNLGLERKVEERTRDLRDAQAQLVQSEKMAALGHLVAGVAHEMNNPVGAVYGSQDTLSSAAKRLTEALESEHGINASESPRLSNIVGAIEDAGGVIRTSSERITEVVKRLRIFAQLDEADLQRVNPNECVDSALDMFRFHLKPGITVRKELSDLPEIACYPAKVNQLVFQLLANANRAIDGSGRIVLRTAMQGDHAAISVADDGRGIREKDLDRIFDPGYTAWDVNVGTGLGLAICYQIAEAHNGRISVESEAGVGSTFTFSLPVDPASQQ